MASSEDPANQVAKEADRAGSNDRSPAPEGGKGDRRDDERRRDDDRERRSGKERKDRRSRSRSRDRDRRSGRRERSRSRDKERRRRSRSRERRQRSRSRDRSRDRRRDDRRSRYRGDSDDGYGYVPRRRGRGGSPSGREPPITFHDPFAALRSQHTLSTDPAEMARQMQEQQLRARQLVLQQQAASAVAAASKTQREVYVGNLTPGMVTADMLRTLFSSTMSVAFADMCQNGLDPVLMVSLHSEGRYAFVELRTSEMATASLQLNGQVQLLGQVLSIGRPSGYVDPGKAAHAAHVAAEALAKFQAESQALRTKHGQAPATEGEESCYLQIQGMITPEILADDKEYNEVLADLHNECNKNGTVLRVVVPRPLMPAEADAAMGTGQFGKAFVQFLDVDGTKKVKEAISGRIFAGNEVQVDFMQPQAFIDAISPPPAVVPAAPLAAVPAVPAEALPTLAAPPLPAVPPPAV